MGCLMSCSQQEVAEESETNPSVPQQEEQPDSTEGKVIADYDPDLDYEGSEPKNEPVTQEQKEEDPSRACVHGDTLCRDFPPEDDALHCFKEYPVGT